MTGLPVRGDRADDQYEVGVGMMACSELLYGDIIRL